MRFIVRPRAPATPNAVAITPTRVTVKARPLRVLDFDIENRPLSYLGSDFTTGEVTAIAWAWTHAPDDVTVYLLGETDLRTILIAFCAAYLAADVVTGHYIRGHDLPMVNGALMEFGLPALPDRLTQDTKLDLMRSKGMSLSQESLAAMFRLEHQKESMNQIQWRAANRLTPEGLAEVRRRVIGDVKQHIELRRQLVARGYLGRLKWWRSLSDQALASYSP